MTRLSESGIAEETATSTEIRIGATSVTRTISDIMDEAGVVRKRVRILRDEVDELHENASLLHTNAFDTALTQAAAEYEKRTMQGVLEALERFGFSWRDLARLANVSVPAIQKWRAGGGSKPEHRRRVARLAALCDLLKERFLIEDVASWLEVPLVSGVPVTGLDLLVAGRTDLLLRWAGHSDATPEALLDEFDASWRDRYASEYEVFTAADGLPGIRFRDP